MKFIAPLILFPLALTCADEPLLRSKRRKLDVDPDVSAAYRAHENYHVASDTEVDEETDEDLAPDEMIGESLIVTHRNRNFYRSNYLVCQYQMSERDKKRRAAEGDKP